MHQAPVNLTVAKKVQFRRIALALDFSSIDREVIQYGLGLASKDTSFLLVHVVETPTAMFMGKEVSDFETASDKDQLEKYQQFFTDQGCKTEVKLLFGMPKNEISKAVNLY